MKRILVVNVNWVGDVIFSTPIFKALRKTYPSSRISCLAVPRVKEILECCSYIDDIIDYDEKKSHRSLFAKIQFVFRLRREKFDAVFLLHRSWSRAFLVYLAGIPKRIGYDTKRRGWLLTHKTEVLPGLPHRSDYYSQVLESYGIPIEDRTVELNVLPQAHSQMLHVLRAHGIQEGERFVVVNTGGNWDLKRWPYEYFSQLIRRLTEELKLKVVVPGAARESERVAALIKDSGGKAVHLAGKTNLKQLAALFELAGLVISSDSGPLHIANSLGVTTVGIFGPTRPEITGPRGRGETYILQEDVGCNQSACYNLACADNICVKAITVNRVFEKVKEIMCQKN